MENSEFDANLSAAVGDDVQLRAELIAVFRESVAKHLDLLGRSRCDGNWEVAAMRLKGLGASFHSQRLTILSQEALDAAPGDPVILRELAQFAESLAHKS